MIALEPYHSHLVQVFEHQELKVGEGNFRQEHLKALQELAYRTGGKYFSLSPDGVRFRQYVGAIRAGNLTIEILPKADSGTDTPPGVWQGVLLDMLRECHLLSFENMIGVKVKWKQLSLMDIFFERFVIEMELLMRKGLLRSYQRSRKNLKTLKGRILLGEQLRRNLNHQERFYTDHEEFTFQHSIHVILWKAMQSARFMIKDQMIHSKLRMIMAKFPKIAYPHYDKRLLTHNPKDQKKKRYLPALELARLILQNFNPDIRAGRHHLGSLLFDMNLLFEEYLYQQLLKTKIPGIKVQRQINRPFWNRRYIRPDLMITTPEKRFIIDTKWKVMQRTHPSLEDLRQLYVYNQYFGAENGVLVYPKVFDIPDLPPQPFAPTTKKDQPTYCQICFLEVVREGKLNRKVGEEFLKKIMS